MIVREHQCGHIAAASPPSAPYGEEDVRGTKVIPLCAVWPYRRHELAKRGYTLIADAKDGA
jgi:hypothetical protein